MPEDKQKITPQPIRVPADLDQDGVYEHLEAIFNSSYDGIWVCGGDGTILRYNPAAERMVNVDLSAYQGKNVDELVKDAVVDKSVTREVIKQKRKITILQTTPKSGKKFLVTGNPIFDSNDKLKLVIVNCRDLTRLDNLRRELMENKARTDRFAGELRKRDLKKMAELMPVGRSSCMRQVLAAAAHVAQFNVSVLITGESGVGKGMLGSLIHKISEARDKPFIRVDCGAIPESLFESEIFGYMPGAFTGASPNGKVGLFEMAEGGTLFLDEIAQVPIVLQHKLLRFLEKGEFVRVGGSETKKVNARIIAATNADMEAEVSAGRFRRDLYYRIKVVPLDLPPLRHRKEDIPLLAEHFLRKFGEKYNKKVRISALAIEILMNAYWPGNVRELENLTERLVVMCARGVIELSDLPPSLLEQQENPSVSDLYQGDDLKSAVRKFEADMIQWAIEKYGTQREAAKALGISQSTITRKK